MKLKHACLIFAAAAMAGALGSCDMWMDAPLDTSPDYYVGVGSTGVNVGVGSPYWNLGWSAPLWSGGYRPAWGIPAVVNPPIPPTRPGGAWNPQPQRPPVNVTPPPNGNRPGAPSRP